MPNLTLSISEELKRDMDQLPESNWSEIVRGFLSEKIKRAMLLKKLDELLKDSEVTDEDCLKWSNKIKSMRLKQLKQKGMI